MVSPEGFLIAVLTLGALYATIQWYRAMSAQQRIAWRWVLGVPREGTPAGYIYAFIDPDAPEAWKWGRAKNWRQRMKQHQTPNPRRLVVKCIVGVADDRHAETIVHNLFDANHIDAGGGSEWYAVNRSMVRFAKLISDDINMEDW